MPRVFLDEPEFVHRGYPAALIPADTGALNVDQLAVQWALQQRIALGGQILFYRPSRDSLFQHPVLAAFVEEQIVVDVTWRTLFRTRWQGGPVLAAWPDRRHLADIARHPGTTALCVLGWNEDDTTDWDQVEQPDVLVPTGRPTSHELADPVVRAAFTYLSAFVAQSNALSTQADNDAAVATLRILRRHGHSVDAKDVHAWATANGWAPHTAQRLSELAKDIGDGKDPRLRQNPFVPDVYDVVWVPESRRYSRPPA